MPVLLRASEASLPQWTQFITEDVNCVDLSESWLSSRQNSDAFQGELKRLSALITAKLFRVVDAAVPALEATRTREDISRILKERYDYIDHEFVSRSAPTKYGATYSHSDNCDDP